jgi:hypothetical protein
VLGDRPAAGLLVGTVLGGVVLAVTYWFVVVPPGWRQRWSGRHAPCAKPAD